jgi:hypothetical protein
MDIDRFPFKGDAPRGQQGDSIKLFIVVCVCAINFNPANSFCFGYLIQASISEAKPLG